MIVNLEKEVFQKLFTKAGNAVIKQGNPSTGDEGCLYRNGKDKCIVGHLIDDNHFNMDDNNAGISAEIMRGVSKSQNIDVASVDAFAKFLRDLQECHDKAMEDQFRVDWSYNVLTKLTKLAKKYELSMDDIKYELVEPTGVHLT
jgi:hypothetical protein